MMDRNEDLHSQSPATKEFDVQLGKNSKLKESRYLESRKYAVCNVAA